MPNESLRILLCGHKSFAARGLPEQLKAAGHEVVCFNRGPVGAANGVVTGPVLAMHENPHLLQGAKDGGATQPVFDVVVNYILLKDEPIDANCRHLESLLKFCELARVPHLVHMSSVSVYRGGLKLVTENAEIEDVPERKGSYGSLKVATDQYLYAHLPPTLKLTMVRPGFILGEGLMDPIIGMGFRFGRNRILMIGSGANVLPVTTREIVNDSVVRIVGMQPSGRSQVFLILDNASPTRREWLSANGIVTGTGESVMSFPVPLWLCAGLGGEVLARVAGMKMSPLKIIRNACRSQRFDASESHRRLQMDMRVDWKAALSRSLPFQQQPFTLPYRKIAWSPLRASHITFWGFGQIVKQKHLPALKRLGYAGRMAAHDPVAPAPGTDTGGVVVKPISAAPEPTDLMVVASPGPLHAAAIKDMQQVDATILLEKPLCYTQPELDEWVTFARARKNPVVVCHNYRFKDNVAAMMAHLDRHNPGRLIQVDVQFQSPSIGKEWRTWTRDERRARTLLMDYSVHYLDLACMFADDWSVGDATHDIDYMGFTGAIQGRLISPQYRVNFLLRQGYMPRRARLFFSFQNYGISLGFFPDTFAAHMADDSAPLYKAEQKASGRAFRAKVLDKILGRDSDRSHDASYLAAVNNPNGLGDPLTVDRLAGFYRAICALGRAVYGS